MAWAEHAGRADGGGLRLHGHKDVVTAVAVDGARACCGSWDGAVRVWSRATLEEERTLFTGDHVMQGSTVVIAPPDGDMAAYVGSLRELLHDEAPMLEWHAPGHGFLMAQPAQAMQALVDHRMRREAKVLDALRTQGGGDLDDLLVPIYADVAPHLHRPAKRSLLAHLLKLEKDGVAVEVDGRWSLKVPAGA